jgi:hypothetical protein
MFGHLHPQRRQVELLKPLHPVTRRPASDCPQRRQQSGWCTTSSSGSATCRSVLPSWPSCPPALRPVLFCSDPVRGAGLSNPSDDGGFDEFLGFCPSLASSSTIRSTSQASCSASLALSARKTSISTSSYAYDEASRSGTSR